MENFNPIKELKPEDPFNAPEGESSDEIESIRLTLISTRNKTRELVNVIKKKNLDFVKDTTTIKDLDRRLRITIARIPIMRGDASTRSDQDEDPSMIFRSFNRRTRTNTPTDPRVRPTPKFRERIINFAIDLALTFFGGRVLGGIFRRVGPKLFNNKLTREGLEELIKKTKNIDDIKIPVGASSATEKAAGFNIPNFFKKPFFKELKPQTSGRNTTRSTSQKELPFEYDTFKYNKKPNFFEKMFFQNREPNKFNIKVNPTLTPAQIKTQNIKKTLEEAKGRVGLFDKTPKVNRESFFNRGPVKNAASDYTGPGDLIKTLANRTVKTIKNIVETKPTVKVTRSRRRNIKNLRGQDKVTYSDRSAKDTIKFIPESKETESALSKLKRFFKMKEKDPTVKIEDVFGEGKKIPKKFQGSAKGENLNETKNIDEFNLLDNEIFKNMKGDGKGAFLNGKSMNNDIAMLNRDTSVTNTRVILMGEIT